MIRVSAPGKTILMGEHAAVYGRPALVAAIDRRLTVEVERVSTGDAASVRLDLAQIDVDQTIAWSNITDETDACRTAWEQYSESPSLARFAPLEAADPARVVRLAIGETAHALDASQQAALTAQSLVLRVHSDIPIGAGFGSSAAIAVAVVDACLRVAGAEPDLDTVDRIALEVERRQHGLPSGVDSATVARGGFLWVTREAGAATTLAITPVVPESTSLLAPLTVFDTGTPAETTGSVVSAVRARRDADPGGVDATLDRMAAHTAALRSAIESPSAGRTVVIDLIRGFEACLEALGVVPEPVRSAIRRIEADGGAAKISGAGGLRGPGAGSLLVYDPSSRARKALPASFAPMNVRLGGAGVRLDHP